jgi:hypothetical protein
MESDGFEEHPRVPFPNTGVPVAHPTLYPHLMPNGRSWLLPEVPQVELSRPANARKLKARWKMYQWAVESGTIATMPSWAGWNYLEMLARTDRKEQIRREREALRKMRDADPDFDKWFPW